MERWIAVSHADFAKASGIKAPRAWLAYRISPTGRLQRAEGVAPMGGVMGISGGLETLPDATRLAQEIFMECTRRSFRALLLDFDESCDRQTLRALHSQLSGRGFTLIFPEAIYDNAFDAKVIISSALWGGSFRAMLDSAAAHFGAENLCLEINRMCHDFPMPTLSDAGNRLTHMQLAEIRNRSRPTPRLCPEMLCRYFSYMSESVPRFVLFDDLDSARSKIRCAHEKGLYGVFVFFSQWQAGAKTLV